MKTLLVALVVCAGAVVGGCSAAATTDDLTHQRPRAAAYEGPVWGLPSVTGRPGATTQPSNDVASQVVKYAEYDGGETKGRREFAGVRAVSPFDNSPNDVVAHRKGGAFEIEDDTDVKLTPAGVNAESETEAESKDEGGHTALLDQIWNKVFTVGVLLGVIYVALYAIPQTRPLILALNAKVAALWAARQSSANAETEKDNDETA